MSSQFRDNSLEIHTNRSRTLPYSINMASVSLSRELWDPCSVLDVYPNDPNSTCVGLAISTRRRCKWSFKSEQFDPSQRATAVERLESIAKLHPSKITSAALYSLARNTLCRDFHQGQADAKSTEWKAKIQDYLQAHSERLALVSAIGQLQCELHDTKQLQNGIAKERDVSKQEVKETRQALETSQTRCSVLTEKLSKRDRQREEDQAANSRDVARLRQQLTEFRTNMKALDQQLAASSREVAILKEAKASYEEKAKLSDKEAEGLRRELHESKACSEALQAKSSPDSKRLTRQLEAEQEVGPTCKDENWRR